MPTQPTYEDIMPMDNHLSKAVDNLELITDLFTATDDILRRYTKDFGPHIFSTDAEHCIIVRDSRERLKAIQKDFESVSKVLEDEI